MPRAMSVRSHRDLRHQSMSLPLDRQPLRPRVPRGLSAPGYQTEERQIPPSPQAAVNLSDLAASRLARLKTDVFVAYATRQIIGLRPLPSVIRTIAVGYIYKTLGRGGCGSASVALAERLSAHDLETAIRILIRNSPWSDCNAATDLN